MEEIKDSENIIPNNQQTVDIAKLTINEKFSAEKEAVKIENENDIILNTADVSDEITEKTDRSNKKKVK